jgi:hypothetical protein
MKTFVKILVISVLSILFIWWVYGFIVAKKDVIVKRTSDYLYVKEYSWYNKDSTVYRYPATKIYQGVIQNRHRSSNFVGVPGKGGHYRTNYRTTVSYNNEYYTFTGSNVYHKYKEGDKVKVRVTHYPYYSVDIVN